MMHFYLDTSALFKRYHDESGSTFIHSLFDQAYRNEYAFYTSILTGIEFCSVIRRHQREGGVDEETAESIIHTFLFESEATLNTFPVDQQILQTAMTLISNHPLKAYDAVQLATCFEAKIYSTKTNGFYFVCDDDRLREAAKRECVNVLNPRIDKLPNATQ